MKFWRDIKDFILSYYYPKNQYFLVSFPKTGRTWLNYMLKQMVKQSNHPLKNNKNFIFNEHDSSEIIIENGTRNNPLDVFKFITRNRYRRGKVLFLVRDPRDVVVSHFHQITKRAKNPFVFNSISDFVKDDVLGFKRIIQYYNLWFFQKDIPKDFLLIKYEDLLNQGVDTLSEINKFFNIDITKDKIEKIYSESSADKMRKKEKENKLEGFTDFGKDRDNLKVRNAKSGGFINELSEDDILFCNKQMKLLNSYYNYKI